MRKILLALSVIAIAAFDAGATYAGNIVLQTPAGLVAGDQFRFAFTSDTYATATSSDISYYNGIINSEANTLNHTTYQGSTLTWYAIASTASVAAINNIQGPTSAPVYLVDGTQITTSTDSSGLWSGNLEHVINEDLFETQINTVDWTGTNADGSISTGHSLGSTNPAFGNAYYSNYAWIHVSNLYQLSNSYQIRFYGISEVVTYNPPAAVPEPSTFGLMGLGGVGLAVAAYRRRRTRVKA